MSTLRARRPYRATVALAGLLATPLCLLSGPASASQRAAPLADAFNSAATTYDVPRDLLVALAYSETHIDDHDGKPSASGGYGVMHLVSNPSHHTLEQAAKITSKPAATLRTDSAANIAGAAAVLRAEADKLGLTAATRKDFGKWYTALAKYGGAAQPSTARLYADSVYESLKEGVRAVTPDGETVTAPPKTVQPDLGEYANAPNLNGPLGAAAVDYPRAKWATPNPANWRAANRTRKDIDQIVIHVMQGTYAGSISWFQNPRAKVSAHYLVRSRDGDITQMVRDKDVAFHVLRNNSHTIGIEHEGWVNNASWFTESMYRSSAALVRHIATKYGIPKDRKHIVGHSQVPHNDHSDPGPHWDWAKYMKYIKG